MSSREVNWKEICVELKRRNPGLELHHAFGRIGRLLGCQLFIVALSPEAHRGKGYGALTRDLRDEMRRNFLEYQAANVQNRRKDECWYDGCPHRDVCPAARLAEVRRVDAETNRDSVCPKTSYVPRGKKKW